MPLPSRYFLLCGVTKIAAAAAAAAGGGGGVQGGVAAAVKQRMLLTVEHPELELRPMLLFPEVGLCDCNIS